MAKWEYRNLQFKTAPGAESMKTILKDWKVLQNDQWEVFQVENIRGSLGFSAHILFMLRRELE